MSTDEMNLHVKNEAFSWEFSFKPFTTALKLYLLGHILTKRDFTFMWLQMERKWKEHYMRLTKERVRAEKNLRNVKLNLKRPER